MTQGIWLTEREITEREEASRKAAREGIAGGATRGSMFNFIAYLRDHTLIHVVAVSGWSQMLEDTAVLRRRRTRLLRNRAIPPEALAELAPHFPSELTFNSALNDDRVAPNNSNFDIPPYTGDPDLDHTEDAAMLEAELGSRRMSTAELEYYMPPPPGSTRVDVGSILGGGGRYAWLENPTIPAHPWGVRCTKFMKSESGRDLLLFSEVHIPFFSCEDRFSNI